MDVEILAGLGIFFGCFARTFLPYLKKKAKDPTGGGQVRWEHRFTWTLVFTVFVAGITTFMILPSFQVPPEFAFPMAFSYGYTAEDIVNKVAK